MSNGNGKERPYDHIKVLSDVDRLRLFECDNLLVRYNLEIQNLQLLQKIDELDAAKRRDQRQFKVNELTAKIKRKESEQKTILEQLADEYGFDPQRVAIDDVTGTIRELPGADADSARTEGEGVVDGVT